MKKKEKIINEACEEKERTLSEEKEERVEKVVFKKEQREKAEATVIHESKLYNMFMNKFTILM